METLRYLLSKIVIIIPILLILTGIYWLGTKLIPYLPSNMRNFSHEDILPPPGSWGTIEPAKTPSATDNVFVPNEAYNGSTGGFGNSVYVSFGEKGNTVYTTYDSNNQPITTNHLNEITQSPNANNQPPQIPSNFNRKDYIRNLSIYENGFIYTGLTFVGEAKSTMFTNGIMPIIIIAPNGKLISIEQAIAQSQWTTPGWVRFAVKIKNVPPIKTPCNLIFQSAQGSPDSYNKISIPFAGICN